MIAADLHVHLWPGMNPGAVVASALSGFGRVAKEAREGIIGVTLTENECIQTLDTFMEESEDWERVGGFGSRWSRRRDGYILDVLPGVQVVSDEGVEVHGFFVGGEHPGRMSGTTEALCGEWVEAGALVVLPFGVGKWRGRRQGVLREVIAKVPGVALGDNGNRLRGLGIGSFLRDLGYEGALLSGSDPLPLGGQELQVGKMGVVLEKAALQNRSSLSLLRETVENGGGDAWAYGSGTGLGAFVLRQLRMQWRKRFG